MELLERIEPYTSYRFTLGLVLSGITLWSLVTSGISIVQTARLLADLDLMTRQARLLDAARAAAGDSRPVSELPVMTARPGRAIRLLLLLHLLRLLRPRALARCWPEWLGLLVLGVANLYAYYVIFTFE
jgi:hypothetical protein